MDAPGLARARRQLRLRECELLDRQSFRSQTEARLAIFQFIEGWYNPHRRHSALGQRSPIQYECETSTAA